MGEINWDFACIYIRIYIVYMYVLSFVNCDYVWYVMLLSLSPPLPPSLSFSLPLSLCFSQVVVASYDDVFPAVEEGSPDVEDNCKSSNVMYMYVHVHVHVVTDI